MKADPERSLKDLMAVLDPAMKAVEGAETHLQRVKDETKAALTAAAGLRNAAIGRADVARQGAEALFAEAAKEADQAYQRAAATAAAALESAKAAYTAACSVADPLLQDLRAKTDRVTSVAAAARR